MPRINVNQQPAAIKPNGIHKIITMAAIISPRIGSLNALLSNCLKNFFINNTPIFYLLIFYIKYSSLAIKIKEKQVKKAVV